jgi:hypothetical protein
VITSISMSTISKAGQEGAGETVFAMSLKPYIGSVDITTSDGETIHRRARLLTGNRRRKARVAEMRYVAGGMEKAFCIAGVTGYNAAEEVAFESITHFCEDG